MSDIFVSAHGGRWDDQQRDLDITGGSSIVYYVDDGGILSNQDGYAIFANLAQGTTPGGAVVQTVDDGGQTYDYSCWYAAEFGAHCGIFEVGTGTLLKDLSTYTEDHPLLLSAILQESPGVTVYWVCCREISARAEAESLSVSAESWLMSDPTKSEP